MITSQVKKMKLRESSVEVDVLNLTEVHFFNFYFLILDENDEFVGPERVWLKNEDIPGLAMTRSFGDQIAASVGILAEPEINAWKFTNEDKFLILASDGVWEFIESEEVCH